MEKVGEFFGIPVYAAEEMPPGMIVLGQEGAILVDFEQGTIRIDRSKVVVIRGLRRNNVHAGTVRGHSGSPAGSEAPGGTGAG